jgi:hypothetical protein
MNSNITAALANITFPTTSSFGLVSLVEVESLGEGKGSTFTIKLPLLQ